MKILLRLLALFLIMPVIELALLVYVQRVIDFWPTIGLIIFTGVVGGYMAKREGLSVWNRLQERLRQGGMPGTEALDGVIILMAGALLVTPGVITDVVGFLGLLPPSRALIRKFLYRKFRQKVEDGTIQTGFGSFGAATWEDHSTGPARPMDANGSGRRGEGDAWQGRGADLPGYARNPHQPNEPNEDDPRSDS